MSIMLGRPAPRCILMLGDSLTRGFDPSNDSYPPWTLYMLLAKRYQGVGTALVNAAGSGYNTKMMKRVLPDIHTQCQAARFEPELVSLWSGANDCILPSVPSQSQHVPLDEYKQNLIDMISFINKAWPRAQVLLITPPPSIPEKWREQMTLWYRSDGEEGPEPEQDRTLEHTKMYVDACIEVCKGYGVLVVDAWDILVREAGGTSSKLLADYVPEGLHLSQRGHKLLFDEIERVIKARISTLDPAQMEASMIELPSPLVLPQWVDLARTPPQATVPLPEDV